MKNKTITFAILSFIFILFSCENNRIKYEMDDYFTKDDWIISKIDDKSYYEINKTITVVNKISKNVDDVKFKIAPINYETYLKLPDSQRLKYVLASDLYSVNYYSSSFNLTMIEILYFESDKESLSQWVIHFELKSENNKFDYYFNYDVKYFILDDSQVYLNNELLN